MSEDEIVSLTCPMPHRRDDTVRPAHGGGGRLMHQLIQTIIAPHFGGDAISSGQDSAVFELGEGRCAFTTDSYVVKPLFFPGGDIGSLAVNGTVNDLSMVGAKPVSLSVGFIIEEGFSLEMLTRIVQRMRAAADSAGVALVTGDTKVVERGKGDGLFINTSGVGCVPDALVIGPDQVRPGDAIILNGDIARHGIAVMIARDGLDFDADIESDTAALNIPVQRLLDAGIDVHCMRDLTRGGLASASVEIAESSGLSLVLDEASIPVRPAVRSACDLLGFDPIHVANEGRFISFVPEAQAEKAVAALNGVPGCEDAVIIGHVTGEAAGHVTMISRIGGTRLVDMLSGEQLPRIC